MMLFLLPSNNLINYQVGTGPSIKDVRKEGGGGSLANADVCGRRGRGAFGQMRTSAFM